MEKLSISKCLTVLCLTALIVILSAAIPTQSGAQNIDNKTTVSDLPQNDNKVIRACHATWGKLGGKNLPNQGIHADFLEKILTRAGYKVETDIINWARCIESVKIMKYDITMAWESDNIGKDCNFFSYAMKTPLNFYTGTDSSLIDGSFKNMAGKRVAYVRGTGGLDNFYAREDEFDSVPVNTVNQLFEMMEWKRIDAFIIDPMSFEEEITKRYHHLKDKLRILQPPVQINIASPAISKTHPKLRQIEKDYEKAYNELVNDEFIMELERIHQMRVYR